MENLPIRGSREMVLKIETSAVVSSGCSAADSEFCGAKLTSTFTLSGGSMGARWTGGSSLNSSPPARWMAAGAMARLMGRSLDPRAGFGIPVGRADPLRPIPHEPINVIGPLANVECALKIGVTLGVLLNGRNAQMLGEVDGFVANGRPARRETRC